MSVWCIDACTICPSSIDKLIFTAVRAVLIYAEKTLKLYCILARLVYGSRRLSLDFRLKFFLLTSRINLRPADFLNFESFYNFALSRRLFHKTSGPLASGLKILYLKALVGA